MEDAMQLPESNYLGDCPVCGRNDGYVNIGRGHWFLCQTHKTMWFTGSNLVSSWRDETEEEQRERFYSLGLDSSTRVEPWHRYVPEKPEPEKHSKIIPAPLDDMPF